MAPRVAVIDYGSGNLRSVEKALQNAGAEPVRCVPGRRHFIARGTRVEIGDQFFVVS